MLACGGAFIKFTDGNITLGGPLDLFLKIITIQKQGAQSMNANPALPHGTGSIPQGRADDYSS